jgi:hypothetical protein
VYSSGVPVSSSLLRQGFTYRIEASQIWFYNYSVYLAADAEYYTTSSVDTWDWLNHAQAPGGHSFLQIDGNDVNWGPFSNGDTNHTYCIYYVGHGSAITFAIVDWMDNNYGNNYCHIHVKIFLELCVGGRVVNPGSPDAMTSWIVGGLLAASAAAAPLIIYVRKTRLD